MDLPLQAPEEREPSDQTQPLLTLEDAERMEELFSMVETVLRLGKEQCDEPAAVARFGSSLRGIANMVEEIAAKYKAAPVRVIAITPLEERG
jgi:hypothetical protein